MGISKTQQYLKRRMWREDGIYYFCSLCGDYKLESDFYKTKNTPFGITYKCKIHYRKAEKETTRENDFFKLSPITDEDFAGAQLLLERLGYKFGADQLPVWRQFLIKHNL